MFLVTDGRSERASDRASAALSAEASRRLAVHRRLGSAVVFDGGANQEDGAFTQLSFAYGGPASTSLEIDRRTGLGQSAPNER